ncbi:NAD(P)/FAD-dependent oxidoreductase [Pseudomonas brassicacearum]|uniref:Protein CbrA n=1 Tax=Pseudomonas brassicacearum TaxID=930166 RepID=A0A423GJH4_9PSED|nr:NAD(P)/FAD-dependent oxidoreductase [Pseudomonas brassicacearum]ROM90327.1 FAD-binding monooxygenase [Pseudomonas brassicacearum]
MSTLRSDRTELDVAVVGGSIAGMATAIRFSKMGYRVAVLDKKKMASQPHKQLCTHFIQPHAVPLLTELGLAHLRGSDWSVSTKAVFVTPGGLIEGPGSYLSEVPDSFALNLERRVLDPAMRAAAQEQGVQYLDATSVEGIEEDEEGWNLDTTSEAGRQRIHARLVVAADGRQSRLAKLLDSEVALYPNERACLFGYFSGIEAPEGKRSIFVMHERDLACTYPLVEGRTLLVLFADKARIESWRGTEERMQRFLEYFNALPEAPSTTAAVPLSKLMGYSDYPSQVRQPVVGTVPFVGDAALSLDPMSGVGCGFALSSADLLARSFVGRSLDKAGIAEGLVEYRQRFSDTILPHVEGICADSLVERNEAFRLKMFQAISADPDLSRKYLAITGRMLLPSEFHADLMRALTKRAFAGRSASASGAVTPVRSNHSSPAHATGK